MHVFYSLGTIYVSYLYVSARQFFSGVLTSNFPWHKEEINIGIDYIPCHLGCNVQVDYSVLTLVSASSFRSSRSFVSRLSLSVLSARL